MKSISVVLLSALPDKKIKSFGNKCLLKINKHQCLLDYQIYILNKIFSYPEIVVVGGFDGKKLSKYINNKFKQSSNIRYVEHQINHKINTGASIIEALKYISNSSCLFLSNSLLFDNRLSSFLKHHNNSYTVISNSKDASVGCLVDDKKNLINCYYGLPNGISDILYICQTDIDRFKNLSETRNFDKLYLFEIINLCLNYDMIIKGISVNTKLINSIDNCTKIKNLHKLVTKDA